MKTTLKRAFGLAAGGGLLVGSLVVSTPPAHAGGPDMVSGSSRAECNAVLKASVDAARDRGQRIDGIKWCVRDARDGTWYGSFSHS